MSQYNIAEEIQKGTGMLLGSATWNPGSIADGNEEAKEITVTGAALGDYVLAVSFSLDVADLQLTADVTAANTVTAVLSSSGDTVDLASGTIRVIVMKRSVFG
jgi:hypothetical protein